MDDYTQVPGYYHYQSVEFGVGLWYSIFIFDSLLTCKCYPRLRSWDPPNTPWSDVDHPWDSDDGYEMEYWGPDEDFYCD